MKTLLNCAVLLLTAATVHAQVNAGRLKPQDDLPFTLTQVATFDRPWRLAFLPDGRMLVTEKVGPVWLVTPQGQKTPVANAPAVLFQGQGGMLGVFVSPRYATDHSVYLTYSEPGDVAGTSSLALARAKLGDRAGHRQPRQPRGAVAPAAEGQGRPVRRADRFLAGWPVPVPHRRRSPAHDASAGPRPGPRQDPAADPRRQAGARQPDGRQDRRRECAAHRSPIRHRAREDGPGGQHLHVHEPEPRARRKPGAPGTARRTASRSRPTGGSGNWSTARAAATSST